MRTSEEWRSEMVHARKRFGLNQTELAKIITVRSQRTLSQSEVSQIENGTRENHWAITEISRFLRISLPTDASTRDWVDAEVEDVPKPEPQTQVGVLLSNDELVLLDDWAIEREFTFKNGKANRSEAIRALVRQLEDSDLVVLEEPDLKIAAESDDARPSEIGIHLVCRDGLGVTELDDGTFETRAWRVAEKWVDVATYVALHHRKTERSYRQGRLLRFRADTERPDRFVFLVASDDDQRTWPGSPRGQYPVGIRRH
jgi:transcriptional regulator with XRE-family HTH domain